MLILIRELTSVLNVVNRSTQTHERESESYGAVALVVVAHGNNFNWRELKKHITQSYISLWYMCYMYLKWHIGTQELQPKLKIGVNNLISFEPVNISTESVNHSAC